MAHFRPRHLQAALTKGLKFSPLVALLGHRQVGKTTLGTQIARGYYTLDLRTTSDIIQRDPTGFLESISVFPTVLDETQLLPELFPALKEHVRTHKKPGQFLLTGSVRFSSRKRILESLTGRIIYYELLPLDISEARERPLPRCLIDLADRFESVELKKTSRAPSLVSQYLRKGGLPGLFAIRDESLFIQKIDTQIETILERDLRLLVDTALSFQTLRGLYTHLALHQGEPLDLMAISRATRVSRPTIRKLLQAYSSLFLIRFLPVEGTAKKGTFYLEDQGEASHLIGMRTDPLYDLTRFLYANLRCQIHYRPEMRSSIFQFRTRSGSLVPLAFRIRGVELGVIPILEDHPSPAAIASAHSFLKFYKRGKIVFATAGQKASSPSPRMRVIPIALLI